MAKSLDDAVAMGFSMIGQLRKLRYLKGLARMVLHRSHSNFRVESFFRQVLPLEYHTVKPGLLNAITTGLG